MRHLTLVTAAEPVSSILRTAEVTLGAPSGFPSGGGARPLHQIRSSGLPLAARRHDYGGHGELHKHHDHVHNSCCDGTTISTATVTTRGCSEEMVDLEPPNP